jgi:hypothetical protein
MSPSRNFKENFLVAGCFTISMGFFVGMLLLLQLWWLLPVFIMGWLFVLFQSFRMGIWKRKSKNNSS